MHFLGAFFKLSQTQMPKSIRLYLFKNLSKVGNIIYHQKATDKENALVSIAICNMVYIIRNEGNKLNTYVIKAVDVTIYEEQIIVFYGRAIPAIYVTQNATQLESQKGAGKHSH